MKAFHKIFTCCLLGASVLSLPMQATHDLYADEFQTSEVVFQTNTTYVLSAEIYVNENFVYLKHLTKQVILNIQDATILICKKPLSSKPTILKREYLMQLLKASGISDETFCCLEIPDEIKIYATENSRQESISTNQINNSLEKQITEIDQFQIIELTTAEVKRVLQKYEPQIALVPANNKLTWRVKNAQNYQLKVLPGIIIRANSVSVKMALYNKNMLLDTQSFNFKADVFIKALVAERAIEKGVMLEKNDFCMRTVPYSNYALNAVRDIEELMGKELLKSIKVGDIVEPSNISAPHLVDKGARVTVTIKDVGYSIKTNGIAQEMGRLGEQVPIIMKSTNLKINCTVTGKNEVIVLQ